MLEFTIHFTEAPIAITVQDGELIDPDRDAQSEHASHLAGAPTPVSLHELSASPLPAEVAAGWQDSEADDWDNLHEDASGAEEASTKQHESGTELATSVPTTTTETLQPEPAKQLSLEPALLKKLGEIDSMINHAIQGLEDRAVSLAVGLARQTLESDEALITERVQHFAHLLLKECEDTTLATLFVHPVCIPAIHEAIADSSHQHVAIQPDPTLLPGDCRIESGDKGFLASLDALLESSVNTLPQRRSMEP